MADARPSVAAIVLAGGSGTRLGLADGRNKVYLTLGDLPLLSWSLRTLDRAPGLTRLVVVVRAGDEDEANRAIAVAGTAHEPIVVRGGATRTSSEAAGLAPLRADIAAGRLDVVLVHDGARPFASEELVARLLEAVGTHGGAVPGLVPSPALAERVDDAAWTAAPTTSLRRVQTPQAFRAAALAAAFDRQAAEGLEAPDTAGLVARTGGPPALVVDGEELNLKVTTAEDVECAAAAVRDGRVSPGGR